MGSAYIFSVGIIIWLIGILSLWQVFVKAGHEGWKSIIPFYNTYILSKIGNQPIWTFIVLFLPLVSIVGALMIAIGVAKSFGKGTGFGILLFFFSFFGYMYLGWGQSEYVGQKSNTES